MKQEKTTANEQLDWLLSEKVAGKVINLYCGEDLNIFFCNEMAWGGKTAICHDQQWTSTRQQSKKQLKF